MPHDSLSCSSCLIRSALDGLAVGLVLLDNEGRVLMLNRAAETLLGIQADSCMGKSFSRFLRDPQLSAFWAQARCRSTPLFANLSLTVPTSTDLKVTSTLSQNADGIPLGRALLFCDVTAEKRFQIELTSLLPQRLLSSLNNSPLPTDPLTPQESRILGLIAQGYTNDDIADHLSISRNTVKVHIRNLYRKMGFASRAQAVSFAVQHGLHTL